ncbi:Pentatricopeptide repeat-containing protein [Acorus gramineus]|uniref:Pentatricopeptide repeat-containing protein n=1 Tax=Acorus gramineus TaxID=55184 RepID=A0AAV9A285_ACOGR|nr:Pentatricopeptide repeat-containing protein [Acorus gramineus]
MQTSLGSSQSPQPPPPPPTKKPPNLPTFSNPSQLKQLHAHLLRSNQPLALLSPSQITSVCSSSSSSFNYANLLLTHSFKNPLIVLWNSPLKSLSDSPSPSSALSLFSLLRRADLLPDTFTCSFVLKACSALTDLITGKTVHALVEKLGFRSDLFLSNTVLHMYASCGSLGNARLLFDKMPNRDVVTWNLLMTNLAKAGDLASARSLFDDMPERSVRSWTAMISAYVHFGDPDEALCVFAMMEDEGVIAPNEATVVTVLSACADSGALCVGKRLHAYSDRKGFLRRGNVRLQNALIDMYVKCGCVDEARRVFTSMGERTVVTWSTMIGGLAMHGQGEEALELFSGMTRLGFQPNGVTFLGVLHAYSHMGLLDEGRRFFKSMGEDHGVVAEIEHYGCMVDLLSRAGRLHEARELIEQMPIEPNSVVWGTLLGGCRVHKNAEMAEEAIGRLVELDPMNDGYYVVLSNIYAEAGRWADVAHVRRAMRARGVRKTPGWSSIEIDGGSGVHVFVAGDSTHDRAKEIYETWDELLGELRQRGYVADTREVLLDMEVEEEKEKVLYKHSEKLAVVFGLLSTPKGATIRIMKNLRVCNDCHNVMKLISKIENRKIVVRDRNRFHCFEGGLCSCGDYW